jgi:hypothetical protein
MSDQQSRRDNRPGSQQRDRPVKGPPNRRAVIRVVAVFIHLAINAVMDHIAEADWAHQLILDEIKGDMKEAGIAMPHNLEELIPGEHLPDIIDVYVNKAFLFLASGCWEVFKLSTEQLEHPIKFVRQYPGRTVINKGMFNTPSR